MYLEPAKVSFLEKRIKITVKQLEDSIRDAVPVLDG